MRGPQPFNSEKCCQFFSYTSFPECQQVTSLFTWNSIASLLIALIKIFFSDSHVFIIWAKALLNSSTLCIFSSDSYSNYIEFPNNPKIFKVLDPLIPFLSRRVFHSSHNVLEYSISEAVSWWTISCPLLWAGARVGHRSLMRYYRQRFGVTRDVAVVKNKKAVGRVLQQYRALGWTGQAGEWQWEGFAEEEALGWHHSTVPEADFALHVGFMQ